MKPKIGLRGKLSSFIVAAVLAISAILSFYTSSYLSKAINEEYRHRAETVISFLEASLSNLEGQSLAGHMQGEINSLMQHNPELLRISIYAFKGDGIYNVASSDPEAVGKPADAVDAAPLTGENASELTTATRSSEKENGDSADAPAENNSIEMVAPLHDATGNIVASTGVYLNTGPRDNLIRSHLIRLTLITNLGLLGLLIVLYITFNQFLIKPLKSLTQATREIDKQGWSQPPGFTNRRDEIGSLAAAFDSLSSSLQAREEEVGLLLDASAAVSSTLHVDKILQTLCDKIASSQMVTYCRISLIDSDKHSLVVRAAAPTREMEWEHGIGQQLDLARASHHAEVLKSGKPIVLRQNGQLSVKESEKEWEWALTPETKSALLLPLFSKDEVIGIVTLGEVRRWDRTPFSAKKIEFYQTLLNQAAIAIDNARLYEKTKWYVRELSAMHNMSQAFTSTLNYQEVISVVAQKIGNLIGAQFASVLLPDKNQRHLNIVASYNLSAEYVWTINKKHCIPMGVGPLGRAFTEQKPFTVTDVLSDRSYEQWRHLASIQGYSSLIALPLLSKDESIGVISIYFTEKRELNKEEIDLLTTAANEAAIAIENARMYENLQDAFVGTIRSLAETIDAKDPYTRGHSERVSLYSEAIARGLELKGEELQTIRYAGYLHDVGKIGIPDAILTKPGKLTLEEFKIIKRHPVLSERILKPVGFPFPVQPIVRHHHERYDGKGYPDGLAGEEIPLGARILFVADAYEAMTSDRPYRKALSVERALQELANNKGTQFDPRVVDAFIKIIRAGNSNYRQMRKGA